MADLTIKDIAKICGVGISTVSRAINDDPGINQNTRKRILKVIKEYNYVPNNSARNLKMTEIITTSSAGGFLCGYKPVVLAGSKEPLKIRHAHSYHRQALKGFNLCLVYWLTRKRVYVLFQ